VPHGSVHAKQGFLCPDEDFQIFVAGGGDNPSEKANKWAKNCMRAFREYLGQDTSTKFEDFPKWGVAMCCVGFLRCVQSKLESCTHLVQL
jgi:hypothetical protein